MIEDSKKSESKLTQVYLRIKKILKKEGKMNKKLKKQKRYLKYFNLDENYNKIITRKKVLLRQFTIH